MSTALRCAGLGHRYGRKIWGLRDCSLDVPAGRVVALVGPNGSGKTTLMSMAAGLLQPARDVSRPLAAPRRNGWTRSGSSPRTRRYGRACAWLMSWR